MIEEVKLFGVLHKYYHENVMIIADNGKERKGIE